MRENRYLRDRMIGRDSRNNYDGRNPYGSRGGYVSSGRNDYSDYARGRGRDRDIDERGRGDYDMHYNDYNRGNDYGMYDRRENDVYKKYEYDLEKWMDKLKRHDKFKLSKEDIINRSRSMGVRFDDYSEEEFMAVYYMLMSDFPNIANDSSTYLNMAKKWLEDDDIEVSPSEKLCIYFYDIVKGECV